MNLGHIWLLHNHRLMEEGITKEQFPQNSSTVEIYVNSAWGVTGVKCLLNMYSLGLKAQQGGTGWGDGSRGGRGKRQ